MMGLIFAYSLCFRKGHVSHGINIIHIVPLSPSTRAQATHFESWGTGALSSHTVTVSPILAAADLLAGFPVESRRARLITVESRPARLAGTLSRHGVTAESMDERSKSLSGKHDTQGPCKCCFSHDH